MFSFATIAVVVVIVISIIHNHETDVTKLTLDR